jgi:putative FmdB family regulatory protein
MPLYEYQCQNCGHRFERIQKFSDAPIAECPQCGGAVRKLVSSPAFQFKGTGWYVTDYARQGEKSGEKSGEKPGGKTDATTESKTASTETKPAKDAAETKTSATKPSAPDTSTKS